MALVGVAELWVRSACSTYIERTPPPIEQPPPTLADLPFCAPQDEAGKKAMMTKELNNGRLAMLATIGVWAQELVDGKTILGHLFG